MEKSKIIMLFLDLEGTIIEEEQGQLKEQAFNNLLASLNELQKLRNASISMHIVSPVHAKFMEEILDRLDTLIVRYNIQNNTNIREVESAVAYPDDSYIHQDDLYDKIFPMDMSQKDDYGRYGKLKYVKSWINNIESMDGKEIDMAIYGGNGLNDVSAMSYIKGMKNGFVICPSNSDSEVKRIASYISTKAQAEGIKDGIDFINTQIKNRNKTQPEETER